LACPMISLNASKSRSLAKIRIRPTARLSTWYAYPPLETRNRRGMALFYRNAIGFARDKDSRPLFIPLIPPRGIVVN
jgi:hypothetical protein